MPRYTPFRVPKGVPAVIRRALRLGKPGRFLSTVKALQLASLLDAYESDLAREHVQAVQAMERARTTPTHDKWRGRVRDVQRTDAARRAALDDLSEAAGRHPLPPEPSRDIVPVVEAEEEAPEYVTPDEAATEWEIGIDYTEAQGYEHPKGRSSDVSFNARLYRVDGRPLIESDVRNAMQHFARWGRFPRGIDARTVNWQDARGRAGRGDDEDLWNFRNIIHAAGGDGLRVGAVKPDGL